MKRVFRALRTWFRGDRTLLRRANVNHKPRVELLEERLAPATDFRSVIGLDAVQSLYPYRGTGYTVAILDTGIDYNHPDLGGGFGAGHRVVDGYNFVNNTANPMDDNGHGTHVAGIIGSSNPASPGIDPDVHFVALKVLDANMSGSWTAIDNALQWVINHKTQYNIVDVNLSLGSGNYTSNPYNLLESDFATLKSLGVFTAVASGNRYYTYNSQPGLSYPSISPNVVSVGATWAANAGPVTFSTGASESNPTVDHIVSFTQRSSALSILAPGAWITSTWLGGGYQAMGGTSMATAVVSGAAILLHQAYDQTGKAALATQDNLLQLMQATGVTVVDINYGTDNVAHTGLAFKRLNLKAAIDVVGQPIAPPTLAPSANQTLYVNSTIVVPLAVVSPSGNPITFSVRQVYLPALAYQLDQQYGFNYSGSYYLNTYGANEKWFMGAGSIWYCILPNGEVRRWAGSMSATLTPANLIATLDPSYYSDPSKLWNASYAGMPPAVFSFDGNKLSILGPAYWLGTYSVVVSASDGHYTVQQTFNVTEVPANAPPVLAPIADQATSHGQDAKISLSATDADGDALTYSALVLPVNGQTPPLQVTVSGNQLTIHPSQPIVGTFTISATVSDGTATATKTFNLTLTNTAPTLAAVSTQAMAKGQTSLAAALAASDVDNDALTFQAVAQTPNAAAYQLNQQYAFRPASAAYYLNLTGNNEKWLIDKNNQWYALLPTGKLYHWSLSITQTLTPANLVATLDPMFYTDPRLLTNANPPVAPALMFSFQGNQLTIQRPATLTGVFFIDVTVSDGWLTTKRTIQAVLN
jgi:hypothetical protein